MITVKIGRHEVLLPVNHNGYTFRGSLKGQQENIRKILSFLCLKFRFVRLSLKCSFNYMRNEVVIKTTN